MILDLARFFKACNPWKTLSAENDNEARYYIDLSSVRGRPLIEELKRAIATKPNGEFTCQLFASHPGCGKSLELLRLKAELEEQGFHVVYCKASRYLELADVDISDILLTIARQVSESLEKIKTNFQPYQVKALLKHQTELLHHPLKLNNESLIAAGAGHVSIDEDEVGSTLSKGIGKITATTKDRLELRWRLRMYLEPRTTSILECINKELLEPATEELKRRGKKGMVAIVDDLDQVDSFPKLNGRPQPEYIFADRGTQLKLNCHVIYTIPLALVYSNNLGKLISNFGAEPKVLPMVPVRRRDGSECSEGMAMLRQVVLVRAFPDVAPEQRVKLINEVFESPETLDRLCRVSGGHVRILLRLLYSCLQLENPPFSRDCLERAIEEYRNDVLSAIADSDWDLLRQFARDKNIKYCTKYQILLRSMFVFEYRDRQGRWFDINPVLAESEKFVQFANKGRENAIAPTSPMPTKDCQSL